MESSTNREDLLPDADSVLIAVAVGGPAYHGHPFDAEFNIPRKYGIIQTVADTLGPGGLLRALRSAPVMLDMIDDINRLAPNAVVMNYTKPMAILTWVLTDRAQIPLVGLCHGVTGNFKMLAGLLGIPFEEMEFVAAGINHMTWFVKLEHNHKIWCRSHTINYSRPTRPPILINSGAKFLRRLDGTRPKMTAIPLNTSRGLNMDTRPCSNPTSNAH